MRNVIHEFTTNIFKVCLNDMYPLRSNNWGVVKTRNAGISRNIAEYGGISRNITEYGGISRNITTFSRNIPEHHNIFRW